MKLKSIEKEAADCRKAFKGFPVGGYVLHCHHEIIGETLCEAAENRIAYILTQKPENERALRLRLFRPVPEKELKADAEWEKADAEWEKADAEWEKADAEWKKAYAEWEKADAEWKKAYAEWEKAYAERKKADAEWEKEDAEWKKAYAEWEKADAEWEKAYAALEVLIHAHFCTPDCPWNGKTILP